MQLKHPDSVPPPESTPESSPVKMRPTKSVAGEKGLVIVPPGCVLVIWVTSRDILNCWCFPVNFWYFWYFWFPCWYCSDSLWSLASSRRDNQSCSWLLVWPTYTVLLTIYYLDHQFLFLIGWYSAAEIWCLVKKRNENDKNTIFTMRNNKEGKKSKQSILYSELILLTRDATCSKL